MARAGQLKQKLTESDYKQHPDVKLFTIIRLLIDEKIPIAPPASHFALRGDLKKFSRVKGMGLPKRYRLFFRADPVTSTIVIIWLGYPRKEGDTKDCYTVFAKKVSRGEIPQSIEELLSSVESW